jgi:hypothetical protein
MTADAHEGMGDMSTSIKWQRRALVSAGSAAVLMVLGPVDIAGSAPAAGGQPGEPPTLTANLSPTAGGPGFAMGYSSVDPCPVVEGISLYYQVWREEDLESGQEDALPVTEGQDTSVDVGGDGSWSVDVVAPVEDGRYEVHASCVTTEDLPGGVPGPEQVVHAEYSPIDFEVTP